MAEEAKPESGQDALEAERLRKAEEFIEQDEGVTNRLAGWAGMTVTAIAVAMSLFHLYAAYEIVPTQELRYTHVAFVLLLAFLLFPVAQRFRDQIHWFDVIAGLTCVGILIYAIVGGEDFTDRATTPNRTDVILGVIFIVLLVEATRRTIGPIVPIIALLFIVYALAGPYLPSPWNHRGYGFDALVGHLFITLEGIFGVPVDVSATLIVLFTIFGAFLQHSGAGKFFIDFSMTLMGNKPERRRPHGGAVVLPARRSVRLGRRDHGDHRRGRLSDDEEGRLREECRRRIARGGRARRDHLAAGARRRGVPDRRISEDQLSRRDLDGDDPDHAFIICRCSSWWNSTRKRYGVRGEPFVPEHTLWQLTRRYWFHFISLISIVVFMLWGYSPTTSVLYATGMTMLVSYPDARDRADAEEARARAGRRLAADR